MAACDLFTVEVLTLKGLKRYLVLFVIELKTRYICIAGIHPQPDGKWMEQMARNLTDPGEGFLRSSRHLIHDRDPLYTRVFDEILSSGGIRPIRLPARSPNLNAYAERFVRFIKDECLNRVVPLGKGTSDDSSTSMSSTTMESGIIKGVAISFSSAHRRRRQVGDQAFYGGRGSEECSISTIGRLRDRSAG